MEGFHIEFNTKFSFLQLPLLLHDKIEKRKAWYHFSLRNKARSYGTCNTSKKGKDNYSMIMKINKNYIELFCTLKMMYTHLNQETKFIQIPKQHDIKFLNTLCKLSHYQ
jgi:hypothetical protein